MASFAPSDDASSLAAEAYLPAYQWDSASALVQGLERFAQEPYPQELGAQALVPEWLQQQQAAQA